MGDARVVGQVVDGEIIWHAPAKPNPNERHYIVTSGFILEFAAVKGERDLLKLQVKKLQELIDKR
jgi:hypothetical protein